MDANHPGRADHVHHLVRGSHQHLAALDPKISSMMKDLFMDDRMKGEAAGIFFFGYVLLQLPGLSCSHWSAERSSAYSWSPGVFVLSVAVFRKPSGSSKSCDFSSVLLRVASFPRRRSCLPTGFHAPNALGRMPIGIFASLSQ